MAGTPNPAAIIMRESAGPLGLCINCKVAQLFQSTEYGGVSIEQVLRGSSIMNDGTEIRDRLLIPAVQRALSKMMRNLHAQASITDIDWIKVRDNWALPFAKPKKRSAPK